MGNAADIAAHTQRSTDVCLRIDAAVTDPSCNADADERRHCRGAANGALSRRIRKLIDAVDVAVGTNTIALFLADVNAGAIATAISETIQPPTRRYSDFEPQTNRDRSSNHGSVIIFTGASTFSARRSATGSYTQAHSARCRSAQRLSQRTFV